MNITAVPEGFYNQSTNTSGKKDTVRVYLHSNLSPYNVVDSSKTILDSVSFSANFIFSNAGSGTYYLQLKHCNSIETWSKSGGEVYNTDILNTYDFTSSASQAFGNNMKQVDTSPVRFAIYSGDENQDGTIDVGDLIDIYNDVQIGQSGYVSTDISGDDFVDVSDLIVTYNNVINVVSVVRP